MGHPTSRSVVMTQPRAWRLASALSLLALGATLAGGAGSAKAASRCGPEDSRVLAQSAPGRMSFGSRTRIVTLAPHCGPIGPALSRAGRMARVFLVVEDLRASRQPGAIFDISLAPTAGRDAGRTRMLGTLNFFNAHPAAAGKGRRVSYDVTTALSALVRRDRLSSGVAIAIAPLSTPERASDASAGAIRLVVQPG